MVIKSPVQVSLGHKEKKIQVGDMSVPSAKDALGLQFRTKPNACTQKIATRLRQGRQEPGRLQNSRLETLCHGKYPIISFAK